MTNRPAFTARRAFTLIEVMLALFILGISMAAIATVMHTGLRAWSVGHATSEIFQTARIAQDVVLHDLDNMVWVPEAGYNTNFNAAIDNAAQQVVAGNDPKLSNITAPIDLSFRGQDHDKTDELSFVRAYHPRFPGDPVTLGLRRVTFYVRDNVLYRKEEDPYGLRPRPHGEGGRMHSAVSRPAGDASEAMLAENQDDGSAASRSIFTLCASMPATHHRHRPAATGRSAYMLCALRHNETSYDEDNLSDQQIARRQLESLYYRPEDPSDPPVGESAGSQSGGENYYGPHSGHHGGGKNSGNQDNGVGGADAPDSGYLPTEVRVEEPICSGVEIFNLTYGYFNDGKWQEVTSWDSRDKVYRNPYSEEELDIILGPQNGNTDMLKNMLIGNNNNNPDNLPGYLAIQIGVRLPGELGKKTNGRLRSFTIYHSMPMAQETDQLIKDNNPAGGRP